MESEGEWAKCSYRNVQVWFGGVPSSETKFYPGGGKFDSLHVALLLAGKEQTHFPLWNRSWMLFPKTQQIIFFSRSRPPTPIPSSSTKQTCRWSSTTSSLSLYTWSTSSRMLPRITLISRMCGLNQDQKAPYATNRKKITLIITIVVNITLIAPVHDSLLPIFCNRCASFSKMDDNTTMFSSASTCSMVTNFIQ